MRKVKGSGTAEFFLTIMFLISAFGYLRNIYMLSQDDFSAPYKAEVIRGVGVFVPFIGVVVGYTTFAEEED